MAHCVTCGAELHPERALKYDYCMAPACQEKNAKPLTMVAVGMNKAADELMLLDERTKENLASGRYADQRRGFVGQLDRAPADGASARAGRPARPLAARTGPARTGPPRTGPDRTVNRRPWTRSQQKLALLYNEQGLRPGEIARKLGLSEYMVTQIILSARNRGKG
jgi:hypothetical protein